MIINSFKHYIIDAMKSLSRNKTISFASTITVTFTMLLLGIFIILIQNINIGMSNVESQIQVQVFVKDDITVKQKENIEKQLNSLSHIKSIEYEDKTAALEKFAQQISKDDETLLSNYDSSNNPLPASYIVTLENAEASKKIVSSLENIEGIESIGNDKEFTDKIISISKSVKWVGLALLIIMSAISIFLISNTIKLTIYSRRKEIGIMKFVGATDWFIRWPFIIEGAVIGLIGATLANALLYYLYNITFAKINENLLLVNLLPPSYILESLPLQFALVGIFIGAIGSSWSLFKFLKV